MNLVLQHVVSDTIFTWKLVSFGRVLKSVACVTLVRTAADMIRITFFKSFGVRKINL
jgi:hypothetical protein